MTPLRSPLVLFAPFALAFACDASKVEPDVDAVLGNRPTIVRGIESVVDQDGVVLVMLYDALSKDGGAQNGCTGSLLAPRLVLTARHCVAETDSAAQCTSSGSAVSGSKVHHDHAPTSLYVFAGKDRPDYLSGLVRLAKGREILTTGADTLCDNDIALIVLDRPLSGATPVPVKLDAMPERGAKVTVVGWGITETETNPQTRRQRTGVEIVKVGSADGAGPTEFVTGEGTCDGDSGGPAIAASGAVLGALSRGGNGSSSTGAGNCIGATNVFTSAAGHADLVRRGFERVGQKPWLEGEPAPPLALVGGDCSASADCASSTCDLESKTCVDPVVDDGGCAVSPRRGADLLPVPALVLGVAGVALGRRLRKNGGNAANERRPG